MGKLFVNLCNKTAAIMAALVEGRQRKDESEAEQELTNSTSVSLPP
ncbi:hypothetical protein QUB80_15815 [Chlorogloeopsis sp. ULAP01]|nr:hypothetical protein [Chlorogloeopsis sp. ULAP01]MDM9382170.1 hypothetical protein [Chlorogloeopsis sp. ULAP01]